MQSAMSGFIRPVQPATLGCDDDFTLARAAQIDPQAFAELYRRHLDRVYRYLLIQSGHKQDAEDLTAQTFLEALQHIGRFRGEGEFAAWLLSIAPHRWLDRLRQIKRDPLPLDEALDLPDGLPTLDVQIGEKLQMRAVLQSLRALAPERAEAITLRIFSDLSMADVAGVMGKSEAAVKMLVSRGLAELRKRLANSE